MKNCMFHCVDDTLNEIEHWETVCRGNPEVLSGNRSISSLFEDCKLSDFCTRANDHVGDCN